MTHECKHEVDIAIMAKDVKAIRDAVIGNGKEGLVIRVDRLEQDNDKRPTAKMMLFFSSIGGGVTFFIAAIVRWLSEPLLK